MRFTPAQQQAITARNRELLVSAAAGSGKTAVLVERIVSLIAQDGLSIDRMLIVTFTRAAAGEMRERLEARLAEAGEGDPRIARQADLVASAQISTIHSFCQHTVRQHFQHCRIDPQFGLCDERTREAFYRESMEETLDWLYARAREDDDVRALTAKYPERDITAMLQTLYRFLMSRPDPMQWLRAHALQTWSVDELDAQPMAVAFCREAALVIDGMESLWRASRDEAASSPAFPEKYLAPLRSDGELIAALHTACEDGITRLIPAVAGAKFTRLPNPPKDATSDTVRLIDRFKERRQRLKKMLEEVDKLLPADVSAAVDDLQAMAPATRGLAKAMTAFHERFGEKKREQAVIDFNDLEHMTLSILRDPALQAQLSEQFDAIFVDEYQDVSELQEAILNGLKRPWDPARPQYAFYVGDVKQSIYRFRLAEPGLFLSKLSRFSADEDAPQRKIILNRNFRSRESVLDAVNRVFSHVMDARVTEIDYDEGARLYPGVPSQDDPPCELHILHTDGAQGQQQALAEAAFIAQDILRNIKEGTVQYRDIAVLLPVSKGIADKVEMVLTRAGIPVYCEGGGDAMGAEEITQVIQYLTVLDNLMNDVPLISVLRSPLFDLSEPELAQIRLIKPEKEAGYLAALAAAAQTAPEPLRTRCAHVLRTLEQERFYLRSMPLSQYLWDFLGRSGLYAHYGAQQGGQLRQANLRMLCQRAADYEAAHTDVLHGFVETLLLDGPSGETSPTVINPWDNVVRIMTIHKSKGLEFPTVYVMNMGRSMLRQSGGGPLSVHGEVGFGLTYVNEEARTKRSTLLQAAVALREKNAERAERARVLYVALTRPKSRLVMVGCASGEKLGRDQLAERAQEPCDVYAVRSASTYLDWLVQCVQPQDELVEGTEEELSTYVERKSYGESVFPTQSTSFPQKSRPWRVVFHIAPADGVPKAAKTDKTTLPLPLVLAEEKAVENAQTGVPEWTHPLEDPIAPRLHLPHYPLKAGVTALCRALDEGAQLDPLQPEEENAETKRLPLMAAQPRLLASVPARPAFLEPPAEQRALAVGVETHRMLGLIDLDGVRQRADEPRALYAYVCREAERLLDAGVITPEQADCIDRRMVCRFLESDLGRRMLQSPTVMREWAFNLRVQQPFPTTVQGVIDLCFVENGAWVLVDFKTDRVATAADLWPRYRRQLHYYRQALLAATPYPVSDVALFALRLGESFAGNDL